MHKDVEELAGIEITTLENGAEHIDPIRNIFFRNGELVIENGYGESLFNPLGILQIKFYAIGGV